MLGFLSKHGNSDTTDEGGVSCRDWKSFSRGNSQLEKKGLHLDLVCTLVLIFLGGFQSSQPSHPPVPIRCVNTLFRILKDNKEYKRTRKDHFSFNGRVTGGLKKRVFATVRRSNKLWRVLLQNNAPFHIFMTGFITNIRSSVRIYDGFYYNFRRFRRYNKFVTGFITNIRSSVKNYDAFYYNIGRFFGDSPFSTLP